MPRDTKLYDILNVASNANESDIRKAYYKLAKLHHPDKVHDKEEKEKVEEKFKEIKFAYEVLTDKSKREIYDQYGLEGLKDGVGGTEFEDIFSQLFGGFGGGGHSFFPFDLFGGGGPSRGARGSRRMRTQDMVYPLKVTLEDLYNGKTANIDIERSIVCKTCQGQGGKAGATKTCTGCKGNGFVVQFKQLGPGMVQQMQSICKDCSGEGQIINEKDRCKTCNGKKTIKEKKQIEVHVDKGMSDNQKITISGESNQEPGAETGNLIVVLQLKEHEKFSRNHNDLYMLYTIGITEALCGFKMAIKHLDGRVLVVSQAAGDIIAPGTMRTVLNEGMPIYRNPFEKGNLYIKFDIKFPENHALSDEAVKKLETLLPTKPKIEIPQGDHVEEVSMVEFSQTRGSGNSHGFSSSGASGGAGSFFREAFSNGSDDEEGGGAQRVECNTH